MSQTLSIYNLIAVPLAPLIGSLLAGVLGTKFGGNVIGRNASHLLTILGVLVSFLLSLQTLIAVVQDGYFLNQNLYTWMVVGNLKMEVGFLIDGLSAMMMCVVTFVSLMVHLYTIGYMHEDEGYNRFFSYISLFTFAMLMLVMSNNFLQLFFGWEAVGLVSYLLIGFWFNKPSAIFANMKAFLINRVGDFGFILGIGLIAATAGSLNYAEVFQKLSSFAGVLPGTDWSLITVVCICLFIGAMGKSAQFPLHVWLPDSMEGPTPISALIHAATMVTAGIFMVARMSPLFELSDAALNFIMLIGSITALFMGFLGVIQNDIKRVVAYSTLSQLGYMTIALGASAYSVAAFHLMTHAFFKALLFLAVGSVIMGVHHNQDIRWMGGLRKYMPITWITSLLGSLALIGTPFFSGFYSKDSIIEVVQNSHLPSAGFANFAVLAGVFVTAFYSFRMYFLVFHGKERFEDNPDAHHDSGHHEKHVPHESPWVVWVPLVCLAIPSVFIGFFTIEPLLFGGFFGDAITINADLHAGVNHMKEHFHGPLQMALHSVQTLPLWLAISGVALAYYFYVLNPLIPARLKKIFLPIFVLLENKYYLDWFNEKVLARTSLLLGKGLWKIGDKFLIDGMVVNGSWCFVAYLASKVRKIQSGYLYHYALMMILGILIFMTFFVFRDEESMRGFISYVQNYIKPVLSLAQ
jgi:NADH-quinone oxidoreductase subunit L